jgi:hypothetical protein
MAEALSDDIESNTSPVTCVQVNYAGPKCDTHYPLNVQYCGGSLTCFFSTKCCRVRTVAACASFVLQNVRCHWNTVNTDQAGNTDDMCID